MLLFFVVVVVVFASISTAANCDINPLLIPLQLRNSTNGVLFRLKNQDFDLPVLIIQNVTVIDDTKLTNNTETENVSLPDLNIELEKYEFTAWGGTNVVGIGLGLESTFIKDLYQANHIPTRSYGLSYNKTWGSSTASLQVDSLVLGGYDKSRIDGESYESEITSNGHLDVEVDSIVVNLQDGTKESLFNGTTFNATLDNSFDQIVFPSGILDAYKSAVSAEVIPAAGVLDLVLDSKRYDTLLIHNKPFAGNMTIRLSNGFEATIPTELLSRAVNGRTVSSIFGPGMDPARGVFGAVFLSQLYLSVDYESMKFSISKRATGDEKTSELEKIDCSSSSISGGDDGKGNSATASTTTTTTSSKGTSTNKILGSVLGSLLGAIAILTLVLFLLKRYKQKKKMGFTPRGDKKVTGYERYSEAASTSRPSWLDVESVRVKEMNEKAVAAGIQLPSTPSRVSVAPSRGDTPARNSYFTEELEISRERDSGW